MLNLDRVTPDADDIVRMQRGRPTSVASEITEEATRQRKMELDNSIKAALERASKEAAERSGETRASIQRGMGGAIVGGLAAVEPVTGALIGAGVSEAVLSRAVPALLGHPTLGPKFARWALNAGKQTKGELATSLAAVLAGNLTATEREARDAILSGLGGDTQNTASFDENVQRFRDPAGRFAVDHSGHPQVRAQQDRDNDDEDDR